MPVTRRATVMYKQAENSFVEQRFSTRSSARTASEFNNMHNETTTISFVIEIMLELVYQRSSIFAVLKNDVEYCLEPRIRDYCLFFGYWEGV